MLKDRSWYYKAAGQVRGHQVAWCHHAAMLTPSRYLTLGDLERRLRSGEDARLAGGGERRLGEEPRAGDGRRLGGLGRRMERSGLRALEEGRG